METGQLQLLTWNPEHRIFRVQSPAGTHLHLSEQLLPGWTVTIDGAPGELERWHGAFQSVVVPAGEHTVEFRFSSPGLLYGAWISLASLVGFGLDGEKNEVAQDGSAADGNRLVAFPRVKSRLTTGRGFHPAPLRRKHFLEELADLPMASGALRPGGETDDVGRPLHL